MASHRWMGIGIAVALCGAAPAQGDKDTDRDGLSDFHEVHKYRTDPKKADSDGDGVPDGDWVERREYQYTVRTVVQVLRPVTPEYLCDDYQDARVLDATDDHVELEVVHYPFQGAAAIESDPDWRRAAARMKEWTAPGPTNDWTPKMQKALLLALRQDGIDARALDDRALVEQASGWLCRHAKVEDGYTSFVTAFDGDGRPFVPDALEASVARAEREHGRALAEQWAREVSARGMFEHGARGSCTSSAIYLNGCLRALGVPTRTVLCIPVVDAGDERERAMLQRLQHHRLRRVVTAAIQELEHSWASHTFNEVFVGGRWVRLNFDRLGQGIFDRQLYGLITHVGTFSDWADARAWETIGRRQKGGGATDDVFGGRNPYSTLTIRDEFGPHCALDNPEGPTAAITGLSWGDDPALPEDVRGWFAKRGALGLIVHTDDQSPRGDEMKDFLGMVDRELRLEAAGRATVTAQVAQGVWWRGGGLLAVLFDDAARQALVAGVDYTVTFPNGRATKWNYEGPATLRRGG
ncbi:MAG: transglutaminase domain-containing protein [Planctomycetota bacterium]